MTKTHKFHLRRKATDWKGNDYFLEADVTGFVKDDRLEIVWSCGNVETKYELLLTMNGKPNFHKPKR